MNETKIDLQLIAHDVAALLSGWRYVDPSEQDRTESAETWARIKRDADGALLHLNANSYNTRGGRVHISGDYPRTARGEDCGPYRGRPSISVAGNRPAAQIAAEIKRRFLPDYEPLYAEALKRKDGTEAAQSLAAARCAALVDIIGGRVNEQKNGVSWYGDESGGYGDATTTTGESWTLKLHSVTWEQAQAVLKVLGGQR